MCIDAVSSGGVHGVCGPGGRRPARHPDGLALPPPKRHSAAVGRRLVAGGPPGCSLLLLLLGGCPPPHLHPQCTAEEYEQIAGDLVELAKETEGLPKLFRLGFHNSGHWSASGLSGGPSGGWHR